jgi:predicted kinase
VAHPSARVPAVILDGRPYTERQQRDRARLAAEQAGASIVFIACTAPMDILRQRIESSAHVAPDRNRALLEWLAAAADPLDGEEIIVDTAALSPQEALDRCLRELTARGLLALP